MDKHFGVEGSPAAKLVQLMRKHGYNRGARPEVGTVVFGMPDLVIRLESDGIDLEREDLIVSQTAADAGLAPGDGVIVIGDDDTMLYFVIDKAVE